MKHLLSLAPFLGILTSCSAVLHLPQAAVKQVCSLPTSNRPFSAGSGTAADPYVICTADQLNTIGGNPEYLSAYFSLGTDLDLSGYGGETAGTTFTRIGSYDNVATGTPFTGFFEGNNHTLSGLTLSDRTGVATGLFNYTRGATIQNLILKGISVSGITRTGALVGYAVGTTLSAIQVQGSVTGDATGSKTGGVAGSLEGTSSGDISALNGIIANVNVTGHDMVGGVAGAIFVSGGAKVSAANSHSTGTIVASDPLSGNTFGGFMGYLSSDTGAQITLSQNYSTSSITIGGAFSGGFIATANATGGSAISIDRSYYSGNFVTNGAFGWMCGSSVGGFANGFYSNSSTITVTNSYSTGSVSVLTTPACGGAPANVGGFAGSFGSNTSGSVSVSRCFSTSTVTAVMDGVSGFGGFVGSASTSGVATVNLTYVYAAGALNLQNNNSTIGGLVGTELTAGTAVSQAYSSVAMNIGSGNTNVGEFMGLHSGTLSASYYNSDLMATGIGAGGGTGAPASQTTAQLKQSATFSGWNFFTVWNIVAGVTMPTLR